MSGIATSISIIDRVSTPIMSIISALDSMCTAYESVQDSMDTGFNTQAITNARQQINAASEQIINVKNNQENVNKSIQKGSSSMDGFMKKVMGVVAAYASFQTVKKAMGVSDELVQTTARIDMMNDGLQSTDDLMDKIFASAQNARGSFSDMAAVVAKFGNNAGDAFNSSEEVIAFANIVQKQMTIAGASTAEASNAMLQLSQALGSGVLRGDELNSIFEQAPNLIQSIATYLEVPIGKIREMAQDGQLTADVVKAAIFESAKEVETRFKSMPMTWGQVWQSMQNKALMAFQPILNKINDIANNEKFQAFADNMVNAFAKVGMVLLDIIEFAGAVANFFTENWSVISPIVYGIVGALIAYAAIGATVNIINGIMATSEAILAAKKALATGATFAETAAQHGLNAALMACPLTWIIAAIAAIIVVVIAIAKWIAKTSDIASSAFGVITGGIAVVGSFFKNLGMSIANIALGIWGALGAVAFNFKTAFFNSLKAVQAFFYDFASVVTNVVGGIAEALSWLPFVEFDYEGIYAKADEYAAKAQEKRDSMESFKNIGDAFDEGVHTYDEFADGWAADAFASGAAWGDSVADKVSNMFGTSDEYDVPTNDYSYDYENASNLDDISTNTANTANALSITSEDLKYLRDIAEKDTINRFTTAEVSVNLGGVNNTVNNNADLDGMVSYLASSVAEALEIVREGVDA